MRRVLLVGYCSGRPPPPHGGGRRACRCRRSSVCLRPYLPCPYPNNRGTTTGEPVGFTAGRGQFQNRPCRPKMRKIPYIWLVFAVLCLDLGLPPAISPATRRGIFSRRLFLRGLRDRSPIARKLNP